ncbi:MAG: hypothetical protein R2867_29650 [Caldilineaceae bacterium]
MGRTLPGISWPRAVIARLSAFITVFTRPTMAILGFTYLIVGIFAVVRMRPPAAPLLATLLLMLSAVLIFIKRRWRWWGHHIVLAAYAVRSLPASVRADRIAKQQIDPRLKRRRPI